MVGRFSSHQVGCNHLSESWYQGPVSNEEWRRARDKSCRWGSADGSRRVQKGLWLDSCRSHIGRSFSPSLILFSVSLHFLAPLPLPSPFFGSHYGPLHFLSSLSYFICKLRVLILEAGDVTSPAFHSSSEIRFSKNCCLWATPHGLGLVSTADVCPRVEAWGARPWVSCSYLLLIVSLLTQAGDGWQCQD